MVLGLSIFGFEPMRSSCSLRFALQPSAAASLFVASLFLLGQVAQAQSSDQAAVEVDSTGLAFFETKIRPVLVEQCYECHSGETQESGLRLDTRKGTRIGGDRGSSISVGKPERSLLLTAISHLDPELSMPPDGDRLPEEVLSNFANWIKMGAPDPREGEVPDTTSQESTEHWAYQPLVESPLPEVKDTEWPIKSIDFHILAELEKQQIKPSLAANPATLLRRVFFDLVGLPPSPAQVAEFLEHEETSGTDIALAKVVDELLESSQFGERWGRHWLDIARFGESSGGESNVSFPYAWRYRDYVIDAFNADVAYDRFLAEQIAGDLIDCEVVRERERLLIATGFLAVGPKNLGENNDKQFQADLVDEQIDALTRAVLGSSVACARCHHHKFDAFTMQDYYGLAGIFASTKTYFGTFPSPANNRGGEPLVLPRVEGQVILNKSVSAKNYESLKSRHAELDAERTAIQAANKARLEGREPDRQFTLREVLANIWRLGPLEGKLATLDEHGKALPVAMGARESDSIGDTHLLARGEIGRPGELVPRAFPGLQNESPRPLNDVSSSGRIELAAWLTNEARALTSRVYVNRIWQHLFGQGLVDTVDNFGTTGAKPSHSKLLDALALHFVSDGWSTKRLIRELILSRTYRQASNYREEAFASDPDNRLLWRMPKRRLEAEAIRDAMLKVSGELDLKRPQGSWVGSLLGDKPIALIGLNKKLPQDLDGVLYRSVYLPVIRDRLPDVLELFDGAEPSLVTGRRETTNVPTQALYLLNSSFIRDRAKALGRRLHERSNVDEDTVNQAYVVCFGRSPSAAERQLALAFLNEKSGTRSEKLQSLAQVLLLTAEFRNID